MVDLKVLNNNRKLNTVKLGYNELGYNELPLIRNIFTTLVWSLIITLYYFLVITN